MTALTSLHEYKARFTWPTTVCVRSNIKTLETISFVLFLNMKFAQLEAKKIVNLFQNAFDTILYTIL